MGSMLGKISAQDPQDQVLSTEDIYLLLRDRGRNKRQIQGIEDEGEGEGKGAGVFVSEGKYKYKGLPLGRMERDVAHRKMAIYKGTRGDPML